MGAFREGYASEASVGGDVLKVPLIGQPRLPRWLGVGRILFGGTGGARRGAARVNLSQLTAVSCDGNDRNFWFDLFDARGHSLRLLFSPGPLADKEVVVLGALRDHIAARQIEIDRETQAALLGHGPAN